MDRSLRILCAVILLNFPLVAQQGDRQGEMQAPLPETLKVPPAPVLSPEEELATFKLPPGFRADLIAAEPLVGDPIALQFGPDGRLWVVEMRGYMLNAEGAGEREPVGAVAVLSDTDDDGRYDRRTAFLDGLILPRAIALVGDGVLVAEPPHLWFCRDTNGDGRADEKTEVGGIYGNIDNPEHNANGLMWAMDNWIYSANHTARYRYAGGGKFRGEPTITRGQWGIAQDDFGRIYYNSNSDPLRFDAVPSAYLERNPDFRGTGANVQLVPATLRVWPGRVTPGVNRGYRTLNAEGKLYQVTTACGPAIYRGALFPEEFRGDAFICEPGGNLVKRIALTEAGGALKGANAYQGSEFLTSTDERFRPVNLFNGPDGALYVVDMYRGILQHRIYLTTFLRKQIEERGLDKGAGRGRIWRIAPADAPKPGFKLDLARATTTKLVEALRDPSGWVRDTAQRLLVEKRDAAAEKPLRILAIDPTEPPLARLHALWTLDGCGALDRATVLIALNDKHPRVCAAALRLAEKFVRDDDPHEQLAMRIAAKTRAEPEVRLQLALTLGEIRSRSSEAAMLELVQAAGEQPFVLDAIVSGLHAREEGFIEALVREVPEGGIPLARAITSATHAVMTSARAAGIERVLGFAAHEKTPEWARAAVLTGVQQFVPRTSDGKILAGTLPAEPTPLQQLARRRDTPSAPVAQQLLEQLKWPGKLGAEAAAARALTAEEQARFEAGKAQFAMLCAACHQPTGQGLAGLAPPLVHSRWVLGEARILARIVLNGKASNNLVMPPWKAALTDEAIAGLLTFIRRSWGHEAEPVSPVVVAEARQAVAKRDEPFTDPELEELLRKLGGEKK